VPYPVLNEVLDQEGTHFYRIDRKWQPKDLIPDPYRKNLLDDARERYEQLKKAEDELQTLDRAHLYISILKRMYFTIRKAQFAWRVSDLDFIEAIAEFFTDYGTVLQNLKIDRARGRLDDQEE
jgi:hypothetical protein